MPQSKLFVSSCTRRQLARRRPTRLLSRSQWLMLMVYVVAGVAAFAIGHGGF
jgi:hypothetical protein